MTTRHTRTAGAESRPMPPGPYVAKVVSHLDPKRMGALSVQLLSNVVSGGDADNEPGQLYTVDYCMPFYGVNDVTSNRQNDDYFSTQQSYGFWAVPPDPGSKVLVIFAEGQSNQGYWIGCIQDAYMNHMLPGATPSVKSSRVVQDNLIDEFKERPLPTGEYNKSLHGDTGNDPDAFPRPHNPMMLNALATQGLIDDVVRGLTSSSARRDLPSAVFGWSTPGPLDKRDGAPKGRYGPTGNQIEYFRSRLGGSSFVMDDGDPTILRGGPAAGTASTYYDIEAVPEYAGTGDPTLPFNDLVRLRTRTGHQILLHNTEDLIYIANGRGTAWIELTSNGKIDIHSDDSVSIHSGNDLNFYAARDINFSASRDIHYNAGNDYKLTVGNNSDVKVGTDSKVDVGANYDVFVGANQKVYVGAEGHLIVAGAHKISNQSSLDVLTGQQANFKQASLNVLSVGDTNLTAGATTSIKSGGEHRESAPAIHMNTAGNPASQAAEAAAAAQASVASSAHWPARVPRHEPWAEHENLNPGEYTPARTQGITSPPPAVYESNTLINAASDQQQFTALSGPSIANTAAANGNPQTVVPGSTATVGQLPAAPVPVNDMQRYFLHVLIQEIGLDPALVYVPANPAQLSPGQTPGHAEAVAMALAQVQRECGFRPHSENMNYSARRLREVYPSRVRSLAFANELVRAGPAAIGNTLYGNRYGNARDEGYLYRGRGLIQLTFKDNYEEFGGLAGHPEIVENPELANDPEIATALAVAYLKSRYRGSWSEYNFNTLGSRFESAVGYGNQGSETPQRIACGRGFYSKLTTLELTPLDSLTPTPPQHQGETTTVDTPPTTQPAPEPESDPPPLTNEEKFAKIKQQILDRGYPTEDFADRGIRQIATARTRSNVPGTDNIVKYYDGEYWRLKEA